MSDQKKEVYEFDKFRLDVSERLLLRDGERVPVSEKAFVTLCALVRRGNQLAGKQYLLDEVWSDATVEENNLDKNISILRRVLGEGSANTKFIETVRGHGYRFVPEVRQIEAQELSKNGERKEERSATAPYAWSRESTSGPAALGDNLDFTESQLTNFEVQTEHPRAKLERRRLRIPLFVALALVIPASFAAIYFWLQPATKTNIRTVAVLPFKPLAAGQREETLEMGMADALISKLSGSEEITVRPLSATRRYAAVEQDSVSAGRELGVEAVRRKHSDFRRSSKSIGEVAPRGRRQAIVGRAF